MTFFDAGRFRRIGRLDRCDIWMIGLILGLVLRLRLRLGLGLGLRLGLRLGFVVFAVFPLVAFARRTGTGVEDRYRYAGQTERREVGEVEGDIRPNDGANVDPGWEFRNPNQNRLGGSATVRAPDDG